jgi:hypothetical protein
MDSVTLSPTRSCVVPFSQRLHCLFACYRRCEHVDKFRERRNDRNILEMETWPTRKDEPSWDRVIVYLKLAIFLIHVKIGYGWWTLENEGL